MIDNHVHVGWFTDGYHTSKEIWTSVIKVGINEIVVSSTSTCAELYKDVCRELRELKRLGGSRVHPILWLTPRMMKVRYALPYMLHSRIKWQGVKFHFESHPEWSRNSKLLHRGLDVARKLKVPVIFHTGNFECCHASLFKNTILENSDLTFVLAHGRPLDETIDILNSCSNTYVDTAFMPIADLKGLVAEGLTNRILFGTDAPINRVFYKNISTSDYIKDRIKETQMILGNDAETVFSRCVYQ